jgi:hypothetical protein
VEGVVSATLVLVVLVTIAGVPATYLSADLAATHRAGDESVEETT